MPQTFKRIVTNVHNITLSYTTSHGKRVSLYKDLRFVGDNPPVVGHDQSEQCHLPTGWMALPSRGPRVYGNKTDYILNGMSVWKEVSVDTHGNVTISVGGRPVDPGYIGMPSSLVTMNLHTYLQVVGSTPVCIGREVDNSHKNSVVYNVNGVCTQRKHSRTCHGLMTVLSRGQLCRRCHSISTSVNSTQAEEERTENITEEECVLTGNELDETDINDMMNKLFPNANQKLLDFLRTQSEMCRAEVQGKDHRSRRWPDSVVGTSLSIWIASPVSYRILQSFLYLPTERLLQLQKNSIDKEPGINQDMIHWMSQECDRTATKKEGGIIFDEMSIQPGIQLEPHQDGLKMFGYVDFGPHNNGIHELSKGSGGLQLATSVLQFVFLAYNGFRFPVAYMLAAGINTGQLVSLFWDLVNNLKLAGFFVSYVCMDGAAINRAFVNLVCGPTAPVGRNIVYLNSKLSCIMDFSHVVKKIRNSLYASGVGEHHKRQLKTPIGLILWKHFQDAYQWDYSNNFLRIHRKLTKDHFFLNCTLKMRNHLAEQVLNSDMLYLMEKFQETLPQPSQLNATLSLLRITSSFINIFRSPEPVTNLQDDRLTQLSTILVFFDDWHDHCKKEKYHNSKLTFITNECYTDLRYCILGFLSLCQERLQHSSIVPRMVNSDVCENIFCQQRATYSGANANPDACHYRYKCATMHDAPHMYWGMVFTLWITHGSFTKLGWCGWHAVWLIYG